MTVQDRFDTDIDDLWSAITDPARIARWLGEVEGDLRLGGEFRAHFSLASGWEGTGRVEACEPPRRLLVRTVDDVHKSEEQFIEATLTADGDQTIFIWEERGMPARLLAPYGAGIQAQVEDLGAYLAGRAGARFRDPVERAPPRLRGTRGQHSTREHPVTSNAGAGNRLLGTLRSADGKGVVRMEDRYDTDIDDLWSAITDPGRLARWYGEVEGDLRLGGVFRLRVFASGWEGIRRVEACEPPRRLLLVGKEQDEPDELVTEVTLTPDGDQTILVMEERGMPLEYLAGYGAGVQIHVEDLAAYIGGRERCDSDARMEELFPAYPRQLAAGLRHGIRARFTRMQDGTAEEFALIEAAETEYASTLPARVLDAVRALETGGAQGYAISRLEHSLQSATRAERDGRPVDYVVAALVHDIGDSLAPYSHGSYAASVLRPFVSEELCWIVSHHPLFQMYYYGPHMGGDKNARERFRGHRWFDATVEFCERYDENCFDPAYEWLPLEHFAPAVRGGIHPRAVVLLAAAG